MGLAALELDPSRATHIFVCGRKGTGKSELARAFWTSYPYDRLVIDPTGDVDPGDDRARLLEDPLPTRWPASLGREGERLTLVHRPDVGSDTYRDDMDRAAGLAFSHGRTLLWVDEVGELTSANSTPPAMRRVLHQSRHRRLSTLFCGPRPIDINPLVISQADYVACFDLPNPKDRARVADNTGLELRTFEAALAKATRTEHGFVWWDARGRRLLIMPPLPVRARRPQPDRFADLEPRPEVTAL